jgi:hypothetical protein
MRIGSDECQAFRDEWAEALTLFGGYGYRPKLIPDGLIGYLADGSSFSVTGEGGTLQSPHYDAEFRIQVRGSDRYVRGEQEVAYDGNDELLRAVHALLKRCPPGEPSDGPFIRHFTPKSELERVKLAVSYCAYRPYLDALASEGIHAYLESDGSSLRMYSDISPTLLLDISIEDEGLPLLGPGDGGWVVFLTGTGGHEAEFTVERFEDRAVDAAVLAEAVVDGLNEILRGGHVYFEHYDPMLGRLDPPWLTTSEK